MPLYVYACSSCGARLEHRQRFEDEPLRDCLTCGGPLNRLIHPVGIVFKGSGWYSTDHRSTKGLAMPADPTPATADSSAATDAKVATKEEAKAGGA
jgi:putative FmdB family regulatory protein